MNRNMKQIASISALALLAIGGTALAQGGPGMMGQGDRMMGQGGQGGWHMWGGPGSRWGRGPEGMLDRVDGRLAFLKAELKITDAQSGAWNRLAETIKTTATARNERMKSIWEGSEKAKSLVERLDMHEQFMTARLEEIKQLKVAWQELYAALSDEQKKEADNLVLPMMGMGGPGMMMGGPGTMGPGMMGPGMMGPGMGRR